MFPFIVLMLFRRFLPERWALALVLLFVAVPIGTIYGTTFDQYVKWASKGFADPAAYIFFLSGILPLIGRKPLPSFFGSLLLALAVFTRPVVSPAAAVFLGGVGIDALYRREWLRCAALCVGFLPVFLMPLHNWYFGHEFLMFSTNIDEHGVLVMPPSAYVAALHELLTFNFAGGYFKRALMQIVNWLGGPAESYWTIPLNAASVAIVGYIVVRGRNFDPWLRLIGAAALTQCTVAFFYRGEYGRYHFLTWFLIMLVVMVFMHEAGIGWLQRRYPALSAHLANHPMTQRLASGLSWLQRSAA
jgi:general stress protein CsbA